MNRYTCIIVPPGLNPVSLSENLQALREIIEDVGRILIVLPEDPDALVEECIAQTILPDQTDVLRHCTCSKQEDYWTMALAAGARFLSGRYGIGEDDSLLILNPEAPWSHTVLSSMFAKLERPVALVRAMIAGSSDDPVFPDYVLCRLKFLAQYALGMNISSLEQFFREKYWRCEVLSVDDHSG